MSSALFTVVGLFGTKAIASGLTSKVVLQVDAESRHSVMAWIGTKQQPLEFKPGTNRFVLER